MTRTILTGARLVLHAERAVGAPDGIYCAECLACPETSGRVDGDADAVARWVILHTERYGLSHSQFLMTSERHWRVDPCAPGDVPAESRSGQALRLGHARPNLRRRWTAAMRRAAAGAGRWSGPFVVLALVMVCTLSGYLFGAARGSG